MLVTPRALLTAAALLALSACAAKQKKPPVGMGKIKVSAKIRPDGSVVSTARDATQVFDAAVAAHQAGRFDLAVGGYRELIRDFPESEYVPPTRYNLGMALEESGKHAEAIPVYETLIASAPDTDDARDARFRLASALRVLGRHADALAVLQGLIADPKLSPVDRYIARIRLADALIALERLDEAEHELRSLLAKARPRPGRTGPLLSGPLLAEAQYNLARVHRIRFDLLPIRLPLEQMGKDVAAKIEVFKRAQSSYLRTVRIGVPAMTTAAGLELGQMYEDFCIDFVEAPIPADLSGEEVDVYYELLLKEVRPLLEEALHVYEKNLQVAERLGASNAWVQSTRARLEELRKTLKAEQGLDDLRRFLGVPAPQVPVAPPLQPADGTPPGV